MSASIVTREYHDRITALFKEADKERAKSIDKYSTVGLLAVGAIQADRLVAPRPGMDNIVIHAGNGYAAARGRVIGHHPQWEVAGNAAVAVEDFGWAEGPPAAQEPPPAAARADQPPNDLRVRNNLRVRLNERLRQMLNG